MLACCIGIPVALLIGVLLVRYIRQDYRKHYCPYCACRSHCNIGHSVDSAGYTTGCHLCMRHKDKGEKYGRNK